MASKYVMVTHWQNHWDNLSNGETHFTKNMLRGRMTQDKIKEDTYTIFIKRNKQTKKVEKAWEGKVYGFKDEGNKILFKVEISKEIILPSKYSDYPEGWYIEDIEEETLLNAINYPPFFYILNTTSDWNEFEKHTYSLLKLLGIHQIHKYEKQRGTPDGFFRFGNLAVIYDTTLEGTFEKSKETQINNFCSQLRTGSLTSVNRTIDISRCNKQIWIITRGTPRTIKKIDDTIVKEVPVSEIIKVYSKRMEQLMDETELENKLRNICET